MNVNELHLVLHHCIDQIESIQELEDYYNKMTKSVKSSIWDNLSDEQKHEVLLSYEESEGETNLLETSEVMKKYKTWL
jgi:predicted transcriptional regulator